MNDLHAMFNTVILPRVEKWARCNFRRDDDRVAEAVALAWSWTKRLHDRGRDASVFPCKIAQFAVRAVRSGRKVAGVEKSKGAMNPVAQRRFGFVVGRLPDFSTESANPLSEALADHGQADPADHAAFRCDYPAFRATLSLRDQGVLDDLAMGHRTQEVAAKHGLSEGRVSQLRREFMEQWTAFHGPTPA